MTTEALMDAERLTREMDVLNAAWCMIDDHFGRGNEDAQTALAVLSRLWLVRYEARESASNLEEG